MKTLTVLLVTILLVGCSTRSDSNSSTPQSASGVHKASVTIQTGTDGLTIEQRNVSDRLKIDNAAGSIKHLYVISAMSGQVLIYSTVRGKVTSSGKRLTPTSVVDADNEYYTGSYGFDVNVGGHDARTTEVLQDDGTYGSSVEYIYWWDTKGVYHQHYITGGQIVHVSSEPIAVKSVVLNLQ